MQSKEDAFAALSDHIEARVQAAEVGIRLARNTDKQSPASAKQHAAELAFLKQLRGKTSVLHVHTYEDWISARSHRAIL